LNLEASQLARAAVPLPPTSTHSCTLVAEIATLERQRFPRWPSGFGLDQLAARETELDRRLGAASRSLRQIPARAIEEARLRRTLGMAEEL